MLRFLIVFWAMASLIQLPLADAFDRIVGGHEVKISKHPHQISLRRKGCFQCPYNHICGGSIYSDRIVITAAHCIYEQITSPQMFAIVAGSDNRKGDDGVFINVEDMIMNPRYVPSSFDNDVAIMFLAQPLPLNNATIRPVPLATHVPRAGEKAVVSGWGDTTDGGQMSLQLQEVELPIVDNEICSNAYGNNKIKDSMICAGVIGEGGKDACQGDSGGPLLVNNELAGIVSWGRGCARPEYPGVYSNVFYLKSWIEDTIQYFFQ